MPVFKTEAMEDLVDHLKIYMLNELPQAVKMQYDVRYGQQSNFTHEGTIHAFGQIYLHNVAFGDMNDQPRFHWQVQSVADSSMAIEEGILRIRPSRLFEHITDVLQKNEPTFSYLLIEDFKPKPVPEKLPVPEPYARPVAGKKRGTGYNQPARYEVDLHIEKLVDSIKGLTNADMIRMQLDTLHRFIHLAIMHRQDRMAVIHGLGSGKLREEVHKVLKQTPEVHHFANEWNGRYGFGATEVFFKY